MENKYTDMKIPADKFRFVADDNNLHDKRLETKPIGFFKDVMIRFCKNKSSVIATVIIFVLVVYAIITPLCFENKYTLSLTDTTYLNYTKLRPKSTLFAWAGWDGCINKTINASTYNYVRAIGEETGCNPIVKEYRSNYEDPSSTVNATYYDVKIDSYYQNGMIYMTLTEEQYKDIQTWQDENGIQIIYPAVDTSSFTVASYKSDANYWYKINNKGVPVMDKNGNYQSLYLQRKTDDYTSVMRIEGDPGLDDPNATDRYRYATKTGDSSAVSYKVRVFTYNYFIYRYGFEPSFLFGTNSSGQDIFTRLASGARFSFILAIAVSVVNLFIGAVIGSCMGYYGGWVDMTIDRLCDILGGVPFMVVATLFQLHFANKVGPVGSLLFAFVLTGWIGMAQRVRMQFYRFKGQEYILAARTLGARDSRLMFKHIFPNSLGTIITGSVLTIPGVIFSESSLTYLGIVNLESSTMTSVGTMLANGRGFLTTDPYIIFFPALFISLLEISFNLFGNGLRDAFNPSLRGVDD